MSKKQKQCQGKDTFHRMNYLHQASRLMAGRNDFLSSYYGHQCRAVGRKSVLKMEPAMKRTLCKKCSVYLKPGGTADVDVEETPQKVSTVSCKKCGFRKRYHINSNYSMWLDKPESVAEALNFAPVMVNHPKSQQSPTVNGKELPRETKSQEKHPGVGGNSVQTTKEISTDYRDTAKQEIHT